jgi:hypothetical protein
MAFPKWNPEAFAHAASFPGSDPRVWICMGFVQELGFDAVHGPFANVAFIPNGHIEPCRIGSPWTEPGGGAWFPLERDELVLVAVPMGDTNAGPVIIQRVWERAQPPASDFGSNGEPTQDVVLRPRKGRKIRVLCEDGEIDFTAEGTATINVIAAQGRVHIKSGTTVQVEAPEVLLGPSPGRPVACVGDMVAVTVVPATGLGTGQIMSGVDAVTAG